MYGLLAAAVGVAVAVAVAVAMAVAVALGLNLVGLVGLISLVMFTANRCFDPVAVHAPSPPKVAFFTSLGCTICPSAVTQKPCRAAGGV